MEVQITFSLVFAIVFTLAANTDDEEARKHYGMSYHIQCDNYAKSFACMSACKSIGFQVFRMDQKCKCSCHEIKTTTFLPFFKWHTNGSTKLWHKTYSVPLYHIIGTLSPQTDDYIEPVNDTATTLSLWDICKNFTAIPGGNDTIEDGGDRNGTEEGAATGSGDNAGEPDAPGAPKGEEPGADGAPPADGEGEAEGEPAAEEENDGGGDGGDGGDGGEDAEEPAE